MLVLGIATKRKAMPSKILMLFISLLSLIPFDIFAQPAASQPTAQNVAAAQAFLEQNAAFIKEISATHGKNGSYYADRNSSKLLSHPQKCLFKAEWGYYKQWIIFDWGNVSSINIQGGQSEHYIKMVIDSFGTVSFTMWDSSMAKRTEAAIRYLTTNCPRTTARPAF